MKKILLHLGFSEKDVIEVKAGYKIILKNVGFFLAIAIPVVIIAAVAACFGVLDYIMAGFMILFILCFIGLIITGYAQHLGQDKLAKKEIVEFENSDGTKGSYVVYKKD